MLGAVTLLPRLLPQLEDNSRDRSDHIERDYHQRESTNCHRQIFNNYIDMKQIQIKLNVRIHKVALTVKFPGHIIATIKAETEQVTVGQEVALTLNEAVLQQTASLYLTLLYDSVKQTFADAKVEIAIYIKSSNKKIPSGCVPLNMNSIKTEKGRKKFSLNKCVDKNAYVETTVTYNTLSQTNYQPEAQRLKTEDYRINILRTIKNRPVSTKEIRPEQKNIHLSSVNVDSQVQQNTQLTRLDRQRSESGIQRRQMIKSSHHRQEHHYRQSGRHSTVYNTENQNSFKGSQPDREYKNLIKKYDQQTTELKTVIARRDVLQKSLKESETQFRIYKQKYENLYAQHQIYIKKAEFKQNINKQQITSLSVKSMLSESEKQKMIYEKNNLVDSFEERERNLRLGFKEKEKTFTDEKNRLAKRLESLTRQSTDAQDASSEMSIRVSELTMQWETAKSTNNQLQIKVIELNEQISFLNNQIEEEKMKQLQFEQNMSSGLELEDDKRKLRKRIAEKQQEIIKQANTINQLETNSLKSLKKYEQIQTQLKQKTAALKTLQKQSENNLKQVDSLKRSLEEGQRKIEDLNGLKQNEIAKIENLNQQIRELTRKNQEELRNVGYESKQRETALKKLNDQLNAANLTVAAASKKNEQLEIQISEMRKTIKKAEAQNEILSNLNSEIEDKNSKLTSSLQSQKNIRQKMQKDYKTQLSNKDRIVSELQQKVAKYTNQMSSKQEQSYYRITDLEQKLNDFEKDNASLLQQLKNTKNSLEELNIQKMKNSNSNEDLQYSLKLKNNQIVFLKQTVEKCNQEIGESTSKIKELTLQIQKLNQNIQSLESQRQNLQNTLQQANFSGKETAQKLQVYKSKNKQALQKYFKSVKGGLIEMRPQHEEQDIVRWMSEAISNHNQFVNQKEELISQLTFELNETSQNFDNTNSELQTTLANLAKVTASLQKQKSRNAQRSGQAEETQKNLKIQLQTMNKTNQKLNKQLSTLNDQKKALSQEIKLLNNNIKDKSKDITVLKTKVEDLNKTLKQQEQDYTNYNSQTSSQYHQQIATLQASINGLNANLAAQTKKTQELHAKLNDVGKQYKEYQKKTEEQSKIQSTEKDKLNRQIEQIRRQLQTKVNALTKYEQVTQTLKGNLQKANKQNISLKQVSESIRKRNQKGASRQKQLQSIIQSLKKNQITLTQKQLEQQKTIKDRTNELVQSRQNNLRLDREKAKLKQQYDTLKTDYKQKEDLLIQNDKALKALQGLNTILNGKFQNSERGFNDKESSLNKEIVLLKTNRQKQEQEFFQLKQRYNKENQQFNQQIKQLKAINADLDSKVKTLTKSIEEKDKIHDLQNQYLTPIREHTTLLSKQLVGCIQVCDDFEQSKKKLMKIANLKAWQFEDKFVSQRVREINIAYQRLKINIMANQTLNTTQYEKLTSEINKVQTTIDRILKGDR